MERQKNEPAMQITHEQLADVVTKGMERALAARNGVMALTAEQVAEISGGVVSLVLQKPIIAGGIFGPLFPKNPLDAGGTLNQTLVR